MALVHGPVRPLCAARFQRDVESRAARSPTGFFQGDNFGVVAAVVRVESFADYAAILYQDCADDRIRMREGNTAPRQIECAF